jgi:acyl-CoA reductase-like NAD-dependent aldehyde dehydrogenase
VTETLGHFIGGRQVRAETPLESINPSDTREIIARFPDGTSDDVEAAVSAAREAFAGWSGASIEQRADLLDRVGTIILERRDLIGRLLAREEGKILPEATGEVIRAGRIFKYFAGEAIRRHGQNLDSTRLCIEVITIREAIGVCGIIAPWNFPIAIPAWKAAPALAFGNTVVLKPAGPTPAIAHALAAIVLEAGAPPGVFNLVLGRGGVGEALAKNPDVDAISFTGSQGIGALVGAAAMARQARVQMEMGGKNPLLVLRDADLSLAVQCALDGGFFGTGQRCTASSRILVEDEIYNNFIEALGTRVAALRVGDALDPNSQMGPAVSETQLAQNLFYVDIAVKEGGRLICGGKALKLEKPGYYMSPALIADTSSDMRINCEEVFAPLRVSFV